MDARLLRYYNEELRFMREMGAEFAQQYPKIAERVGLEGLDCADPFVERLLEAFSFLTARIQLKMDAEFPRFTQHLLQTVYPQYIAPTPAMAVVQFRPEPDPSALQRGFMLKRGTTLRGRIPKSEQTHCTFRTAHDVQMWPITMDAVEYLTTPEAVLERGARIAGRMRDEVKGAIRLRLTTPLDGFDKLDLNKLTLYLTGAENHAAKLYEQLLADSLGLAFDVDVPTGEGKKPAVRRVGFAEDEALLPPTASGFSGYRLLHEYFAFPERYLFVSLEGLQSAVKACRRKYLDVFVLLRRTSPELAARVQPADFLLNCVPIINLFPKRCDRIHVSAETEEFHVVADRARPVDYEIYRIDSATGYGANLEDKTEFLPFYALQDSNTRRHEGRYFTTRREPRQMSESQRRMGSRSSYIGSEVFISLVDGRQAPFSHNLRQLSAEAWCTNRDLPLLMPISLSTTNETDFTIEESAPVAAVKCITGPTRPSAAYPEGEWAWRLIGHLGLNYLGLENSGQGRAVVRELLSLYEQLSDAHAKRQSEGVASIDTRVITRPVAAFGSTCYARGTEIKLTCDENAYAGTGVFLFGAVLEEFFARYAAINSFTELSLWTTNRREVYRWPARLGRRRTI